MDEKKKGLAILLGLPKGDGKDDDMGDDAEESSGYEEGLDAAAEEVMQAFKDEDAGALKDALKSFVELCRDSDKDEE